MYTYNVGKPPAQAVDNVFWFIIIISLVLLVLITFLMIYFAVRYNRKKHPESQPVRQKAWLEILWTLVPTALVLAMFFYGYHGFKLLRTVPEDAMKVKVFGRMWDWSFEYENGKRTDKLYVPVNQNIKLEMISLDVIHSLYIPTFRIKEDLLPGKETYMWFKPQTTGPADIFCAEYCGQRHAYMLSQVIVMKQDEFDAWYKKKEEPKAPGELPQFPAVTLMKEQGCLDCHSLEDPWGSSLSLRGLFGMGRLVLKDGQEVKVTADEDYLRRAILQPGLEVVVGEANQMEPADNLSEEQVQMIINFLKELK